MICACEDSNCVLEPSIYNIDCAIIARTQLSRLLLMLSLTHVSNIDLIEYGFII
jgi:hypothetical protein